jgi:hypothetical protein
VYLQLLPRACVVPEGPLLTGDRWDRDAVVQYLLDQQRFLELLMSIMYCLGGQGPRGTECFSLLHCNEPSAERAIYVYNGYLICITRHHKSRRATNQEFIVACYLPHRAGDLLYYYLVYIRRFVEMLQRTCFTHVRANSGLLFYGDAVLGFSAIPRPWTTANLTKTFKQVTRGILNELIGVQLYRQLSIAITEKHVKQLHRPFNHHDDRSPAADIEVAFAWQSGHRPLQRGTNYGLDGAFPDTLQPALLRVYEWASTEWHRYLGHQSRPPSTPAPAKAMDRRVIPFRPSTSDGPSALVHMDQDSDNRHRGPRDPENVLAPRCTEVPTPQGYGNGEGDAVQHPTTLKRAAATAHSQPILPIKRQKLLQLHSRGDSPSVEENEALTDLSPSRFHLDSVNPSAPPLNPENAMLHRAIIAATDHFEHLIDFQVIVCKQCKYAVLLNRLDTHLGSSKHRIGPIQRRQIQQEIATWPGLLQDEADLVRLPVPVGTPPPFAALEIHLDGRKCMTCHYIACTDCGIKRDCRDKHQWINPWATGHKAGDRRRAGESVDRPWIDGIHCQRFFVSGKRQEYFEVAAPRT